VRLPFRDPESLKPLVALLAVAWPLTIRIFSLAWMSNGAGGLDVGHLATYADGAAHLAYAGRFVSSGSVPIDLPMAAGEPARYHLLADFFGAQVSLLGISLHSALAVTSGFLALFFPAIAYCCGVRLWAGGGRRCWASSSSAPRHPRVRALVGDLEARAGGSCGSCPDYSRDPDSLL
jgi:hypothetical protein